MYRRNHSPGQQNPEQLPSDTGPAPLVVNLNRAVRMNTAFRTALWTGGYLQLTLMRIRVREDIGFERHDDLDQLLYIEQGTGLVKMGDSAQNPYLQKRVSTGYAIIVPAGTWHNLINIGDVPLKLYSIYAPPQHPRGTIHRTKAEAIAAEH